jgi:hypothetical protein
VEVLEAGGLGLSQDPRELGLQAVVRRWLLVRVDLELLGTGLDSLAERLDQRRVGQLSRQHDAWKQDGLTAHALTSSRSTSRIARHRGGLACLPHLKVLGFRLGRPVHDVHRSSPCLAPHTRGAREQACRAAIGGFRKGRHARARAAAPRCFRFRFSRARSGSPRRLDLRLLRLPVRNDSSHVKLRGLAAASA